MATFDEADEPLQPDLLGMQPKSKVTFKHRLTGVELNDYIRPQI